MAAEIASLAMTMTRIAPAGVGVNPRYATAAGQADSTKCSMNWKAARSSPWNLSRSSCLAR